MSPTLLLLSLLFTAPPAATCHPHESAVVVNATAHQLSLCEDGQAVARHRVALGAGGLGKRKQGDAKTPLGLYPLGAPRPSQLFGTFVPVGYPTGAQQQRGFT